MAEVSGNGKASRRTGGESQGLAAVLRWLRGLFGLRNGDSQLRETIEEIIGEIEDKETDESRLPPIGSNEKLMLGNILKLHDMTTYDVMIPRADIVAVELATPIDELVETLSRFGHSRLPVYREVLDEVIGIVHIKDVLGYLQRESPFDLADIVRRVLVVAPSMRVLDLLLEMRLSRVHMALVVDEFGGIDGLITIEDLVEEIVGEIEDEHDVSDERQLVFGPDGSLVADARVTTEEFQELVGPVFSKEDEEEDIDTLGGLLFAIAGRVPTRGELIVHSESGISFEVLEADPRRVKRLRIRNLPSRPREAHEID